MYKAIRFYFLLLMLEGIPALILLFQIPSEERNAALWGFSTSRITLGFFVLVSLGILGYFTIKSLVNTPWTKEIGARIEQFTGEDDRLRLVLITLFCLSLTSIIIIAVLSSPVRNYFGSFRYIFERSKSVIVWATLAILQTLGFLLTSSYPVWRKDRFFTNGKAMLYFLLLIIGITTILHWSTIILHDAFLNALPYWWMRFVPMSFTNRHLIFVVVFLGYIASVVFILQHPQKALRNIILLVAIGYSMQVSFGVIDGGGFESLRAKLVHSNHNRYAEFAVKDRDTKLAISQYEDIYGEDRVLSTKPPGGLIFYRVLERFANLGESNADVHQCYVQLTQLVSYLFPFIASLNVVVLFALSAGYFKDKETYLPSILFLVFPNFLLVQLQLDQAIYPLLFIIGVYFQWITIKKRSLKCAFTTGVFLYFVIFFSFSLIPLLALLMIWMLLIFINGKSKSDRLIVVKLLVFTVLGFGLTHVIFFYGLQYNFIARYLDAMAHHRLEKDYEPGLGWMVYAFLINNLEFLLWSGIPVVLLAISRVIRAGNNLIKRRTNNLDLLSLSFAGTFIAVTLFGQTRGEVGRIWMFMLPVVSLLAANELVTISGRRKNGVLLLIAIQLITTYLIFKFQYYF